MPITPPPSPVFLWLLCSTSAFLPACLPSAFLNSCFKNIIFLSAKLPTINAYYGGQLLSEPSQAYPAESATNISSCTTHCCPLHSLDDYTLQTLLSTVAVETFIHSFKKTQPRIYLEMQILHTLLNGLCLCNET